jgi:glutathione peroxidase
MASAESFYDLSSRRLDGTSEALANYRGKVALVVNTASECGFTRQYAGLQRAYEKFKDRGFVILGFPSNDFGGQEPGGAEQIAEFCSRNYGVTFPLFEKVHTKGAERSEIFTLLSEAKGAPKWNFHKYLIDREGKVVAAFPSSVEPDSPELEQAVEKLL